jgi:hypothetical protein
MLAKLDTYLQTRRTCRYDMHIERVHVMVGEFKELSRVESDMPGEGYTKIFRQKIEDMIRIRKVFGSVISIES